MIYGIEIYGVMIYLITISIILFTCSVVLLIMAALQHAMWMGWYGEGGGRHQMRHPTKQGRIGIFATVKKLQVLIRSGMALNGVPVASFLLHVHRDWRSVNMEGRSGEDGLP